MIRAFVEPSGEAPSLAATEVESVAAALGGRILPEEVPGLVGVELADLPSVDRLAGRLGLARRCLVAIGGSGRLEETLRSEGRSGARAVFRRLGGSGGGADAGVLDAGRIYRAVGGRIDLEAPERRYWLSRVPGVEERIFLEVAAVDRAGPSARRMPHLPFQRPVSLPPRLARAAANLTRIVPGDRVVDPFLGTGALLAEAALVGARVYGIDRDPEMVRGAVRNFAHLGTEAVRLVVGDAGEVDLREPGPRFDAVLTDPPYGRSSSTGGESADRLVARVLPRWGERVRPGGRIVAVVPSGAPPIDGPWTLERSVLLRVHRSLTREFRVYVRTG